MSVHKVQCTSGYIYPNMSSLTRVGIDQGPTCLYLQATDGIPNVTLHRVQCTLAWIT